MCVAAIDGHLFLPVMSTSPRFPNPGFSSVKIEANGNVYAAGEVGGGTGTTDFGNGVTLSNFAGAILAAYDSRRHRAAEK